ncbi:YbaB/EbfC family nucleoid-associated protein [Nocardia vermiculata]|uniref:YbaB/EbfC family nucleoid-associated protein n=1 Tax=Nocardia vermiculata TaxID=257274 RepID=A0A846XZR0_9NOCA|nr:YbaB/EbfC family nucleoid-associated protein [Nocardia vermiculata]NKY50528.1 YbaB/EbfC family nucleoid-associated protein [Nocardia vermiculata]
MNEWERDQIRSANDGLRATLDSIQGDFERELGELDEVQRKLAALQVRATSPNNLAIVTVNGSGMVTEIKVADDAFRRSTPQKLTTDINEAIRGGVDAATQARAKILEPLQTVADGMADLDEVLPGMPSMRELRQRFSEFQDGMS